MKMVCDNGFFGKYGKTFEWVKRMEKHIYIGMWMIKGESSVDRRLGPLVLCFL